MTRFPFAPVSATRAAEGFPMGALAVEDDRAVEAVAPSHAIDEADES
ncbi:hypothetical protein GCM10010922_21880 [Microbacterium sorbitolivorans]|nr:hypothetical protein [Microbacterium sorbitolivorans]GGF45766.1 hypothetical protein GCM10010922_21880 [Microbacterium sorbitolivorans]